MKAYFTFFKKAAIAGFFFLFPVFVILIIVTKAFNALTSVGSKIAAMFGMKTIVGFGSTTIITGILLILICFVSGLLVVRSSFLQKFNKMIENKLMHYIPGYEMYKTMAEEKLKNKAKVLPYTAALQTTGSDFSRPVFIIEKDKTGNAVIFLPNIPDTSSGQLLIVKEDTLKTMQSLSANELDGILKTMGTGLLSKC